MSTPAPHLGDRFLAAMGFAHEVHGGHVRLGTGIPYVAHLLVVAGLVVEDGGDEDQAIAALLHDAVEDGGGRPTLERIEREFGPRVAAIVEACSDTLDAGDERSWRERKENYLSHLHTIDDPGILRVSLADKVHNARSIVREYRDHGEALWERFTNKTPADQLWYYRALLDEFEQRPDSPLVEDLRRATTELEDLLRASPGATSPRTPGTAP